MDLLTWLIVGLIAGVLASLIVGSAGGILIDIVVGIVGAFIGGWLSGVLHVSLGHGWIGSILTAVIGAVILLFVLRVIKRA